MMKNLLSVSPSTITLLPSGTSSALEAAGHAGDDGLRQSGEQRHVPQRLGRKRGGPGGHVHFDPLGLGQLDLGAVDPIDAAADLHPRQLAQQQARGDRRHHRRRLRGTRPGSWPPTWSRFSAIRRWTCLDSCCLRVLVYGVSTTVPSVPVLCSRLTRGTAWWTDSVRQGPAARRRPVFRGSPADWRPESPPRPLLRN